MLFNVALLDSPSISTVSPCLSEGWCKLSEAKGEWWTEGVFEKGSASTIETESERIEKRYWSEGCILLVALNELSSEFETLEKVWPLLAVSQQTSVLSLVKVFYLSDRLLFAFFTILLRKSLSLLRLYTVFSCSYKTTPVRLVWLSTKDDKLLLFRLRGNDGPYW